MNNLLFPPRCPVCDEILFDGKNRNRPEICPECEKKIIYIHQPTCYKCGKQLDQEEREFCYDCSKKNFTYKQGIAAFAYTKAMKQSMYAFKYNNRREYAEFYARKICLNYAEVIRNWNADVIIPVPLHASKERKRGYNQAEVLAGHVGKILNLPVDNKVIKRVRKTKPQKEITDKERYSNIENAFQIETDSVKYKKVILTDDIYTSGATIEECSRILKMAGVNDIYFITACIGRGF